MLFCQITETKITPADGEMLDYFGRSVFISGDYSIVAADLDDDNGYNSGSAYIFRRKGTDWIEEAKLLPHDGAPIDYFGASVCISGEIAVIGANDDDDQGSGSGSAYIFRRGDTSWTEEAKLTPADGAAGDHFGVSVSVSGDYVMVGSFWDDDHGAESGSVYVFRNEGGTWIEEAKLTAGDGSPQDYFGFSVSMSGDYAVVGAYRDDDNGIESGSAYVFRREGATWVEEAKLTAGDGAAIDFFGYSVSISGDYTILGAYHNDEHGANSGSAYVFRREGTSWTEEAKLTASDAEPEDFFGHSVSISGDYAIVGAFHDDDAGSEAGSAYLFKHEGTGWIEVAKLTASDGEADDAFGLSVSISGDNAIAGALGGNDHGFASGSAYVYSGFSGGSTALPPVEDHFPWQVTLHQNYPNPFNPRTRFSFSVPHSSIVTLSVYDVLGREVATLVNEKLATGTYEREWDATGQPSGVYFYRLQSAGFTETKKLVLVR
jgi:hypothetical protein